MIMAGGGVEVNLEGNNELICEEKTDTSSRAIYKTRVQNRSPGWRCKCGSCLHTEGTVVAIAHSRIRGKEKTRRLAILEEPVL